MNATEVTIEPAAQMPALPSMPPQMAPAENPTIAQLQAQLAAAQLSQQQQFVASQAPPPMPAGTMPPPIHVPTLPPTMAPPTMAPMPSAPPVAITPQIAPMPPTAALPVSPVPLAAPPIPQTPQPVAHPTPASPPALNLSAQMEAIQGSNGGGGGIDILKSYDLSGVETNNFRLLPLEVSVYEGRITKAELGKSSTGFPQIKLSVKTCYPSLHAGVSINDYVTIQPNTMWKYKGLLEACGLLSPDGQRFAGNSMADFVGKIVQFQIKHDTYDGDLRNKINGGYSAGRLTEEVVHQAVTPAGAPAIQWAPPTG